MLIVKVIAISFQEESFSLKTHVLFSCVNATPAGFMVRVKIDYVLFILNTLINK